MHSRSSLNRKGSHPSCEIGSTNYSDLIPVERCFKHFDIVMDLYAVGQVLQQAPCCICKIRTQIFSYFLWITFASWFKKNILWLSKWSIIVGLAKLSSKLGLASSTPRNGNVAIPAMIFWHVSLVIDCCLPLTSQYRTRVHRNPELSAKRLFILDVNELWLLFDRALREVA